MLGNLRKGVVFRDDQPGIGFVIPKDDVEARPEALDEIGFQQQRLGLGPCGDYFERPGFKHHAPEAFRQPGDLGIGSDAFAERPRLADVKRLPLLIQHAIDAGGSRQGGQGGFQHRQALEGRAIRGRWRGFGHQG